MDRRSRYRGAMLGLAAGDALGTTVEFTTPGEFEPLTDIVGGGPFILKAGEWTDDTSMALCLAESLITRNGFDPVHQLQTYVSWYREGHWSVKGRCFDVGTTTARSLHRFEATREPYCGPTDPDIAGNGSLMRLAPVPLAFARRPAEAIARSGDSSRTTHAAPVCVDSCRYFGSLIVAALDGVPKDRLLSTPFAEPLDEKVAAIAAGSFKRKEPPAIRGGGYVIHCLEAALWAFHKTDTFRDGALLAVNLGEDADTTGAVYGQVAGAYYGEEGIPPEWRGVLAMRSKIEEAADRLYEMAELWGTGMTQMEWLACSDPFRMVSELGRGWERKLRLFAVACCGFWPRASIGQPFLRALELAERLAETEVDDEERRDVAEAVHEAVRALAPSQETKGAERAAGLGVNGDAWFAALGLTMPDGAEPAERAYQVACLHDVFGPLPFRPVAFDPRWRTADTLGLARGIYEERAFDRLPLLADALMDAGCADEQVLGHCRGEGPHVRGCWVVDLVLGKE